MAPPQITPEQRAAGLEKARLANAERAQVKDRIKAGTLTLAGAIALADGNDAVGKMKVTQLLQALPGVGNAKAAKVMEKLGIDPKRRISGLGANQRRDLAEEFTRAVA